MSVNIPYGFVSRGKLASNSAVGANKDEEMLEHRSSLTESRRGTSVSICLKSFPVIWTAWKACMPENSYLLLMNRIFGPPHL